MNLHQIARALGGVVVSRQVLAPGPRHSVGDRSLSVSLSKSAPDGFLCHSFAGDDFGECRDYVRARLGIQNAAPIRENIKDARPKNEIERRDFVRRIFRECRDPRKSLAEIYLNNRRLELDDNLARTIRFHGSSVFTDENGERFTAPAMVCAMRNIGELLAHVRAGGDDRAQAIDDPKFISAIHRRALTSDGRKLSGKPKMLGPAKGSAVMLDDIFSVFEAGELSVAEGVETAMSMRVFGFTPCWALGSTSLFDGFPIIDEVSRLIIAQENDEASRKACERLADRWLDAGKRVDLATPIAGNDANDELLEAAQ